MTVQVIMAVTEMFFENYTEKKQQEKKQERADLEYESDKRSS